MNMGKSPLLSSSLLFLIPFILSIHALNSSSCPMDLGYVERLSWNSSQCHQPMDQNCCMTLRSVFGIGLAQHLKDTSMFYLPTAEAASSCLSDFQAKLTAMSMSPGLVSRCLNDTNEFVAHPSGCAGITTIEEWVEKVGSPSPLDSLCNGDLTGLRCASCLDAGMRVNSQLLAQAPNSTKCFQYTILYAAGIVNDLGPLDPRASSCILALPLVRSDESDQISRKTLLLTVFGLLGGVVGVAIAIGAIFMYRNWSKKKKQNASHRDYISGVKARVLPNSGAKWFQVGELEQATNGFSQRNLIGQGGYGIVYKGVLSDGTVIAVKEIRELESKGDEEFANEVEIISNIRHRNLLSLRGCCATSDAFRGKRRYLVYDFMSNGSLDDHMFNHHGRQLLTWPQRKNIILDVAKGLAYLHYGLKPAIYHRDIKATNILLDTEMKARVADFGLAKQSTEGQSHLTTRVAGTYGYLAPEYALYGQLTEKSDVYSFGIVILEVMSGRKVLDASSSSTLLITDWAWSLVKSGNVKDFFDESIREVGPKGVMERFVFVGILCAHVMVALRPTIADALKMLEGDIDIPRLPDRPLPLSHESFRSSLLNSLSTNETSRGSLSIRIISQDSVLLHSQWRYEGILYHRLESSIAKLTSLVPSQLRMIKVQGCHKKLSLELLILTRMYSSSEAAIKERSDTTKRVCKIMMSCPKLGLDTALDQSGIRVSSDVVEEVLKKFENAGMLTYRFFEWAGKQRNYEHSIRAYHTVIESLSKIRQYQIMWDLVNNMRTKGMLNVETFCIVMRRYARAQKVEEAVYTFNVMEKYGVSPNLAAFNGLLSALCKSKNVRKAQEIFDKMKDQFIPDSKTYSILLEGWGRDPNLPKAREIFREMVGEGCSPDIVTYGIMVDILCKAGRVDEAIGIVREMESSDCRPTSFIYTVLVHTYGIENRIEDAIETFLEMERTGVTADVAVYNALISAFCKVNKFNNVYRVLNEMDCKGITPNSRTCNIILNSLISRGENDEAFKVFRRMIKICQPDADTYTMMIKMFCEMDELEMAFKVWKYMKLKQFVPSMHTFSALINGLCEKANASDACVLMEEMIEKGIRPSRVTFGKLRQLLIKEGREDVLRFLQEKLNLLVKEPLWD